MTFVFVLITFALIVAFASIKLVSQASVKIIERLGKFHKVANSGLNIIVPFIDKVRATLDLREQLIDIDPQSVITRDNVTMQVDCVIYWQVIDPVKTVYEIFNVRIGIQQLTISTIRSVIGEMDLDHTLSSREIINNKLRTSLDVATDKWGVKVIRVEVRNIIPPEDIRVTMEKQMTAERNRRAAILTAEGEKQSEILTAEGRKQAAIVSAEGEREKNILEAEGIASAKLKIAEAEAKSLQIVTEALEKTKSDPATYLIALKYIEALKKISDTPNKMVFMPYEATSVLSSLGTMKELFNETNK